MNFGTKVQISHEIPKHRLRFFALCDVIPVSHARACRSGSALSGVFLSAGRQRRGNGMHGTDGTIGRTQPVCAAPGSKRQAPAGNMFRPAPESGVKGARELRGGHQKVVWRMPKSGVRGDDAGLRCHADWRRQSVHRAVSHASTCRAASRGTVRGETQHAERKGLRGCINRHPPRTARVCRGGG